MKSVELPAFLTIFCSMFEETPSTVRFDRFDYNLLTLLFHRINKTCHDNSYFIIDRVSIQKRNVFQYFAPQGVKLKINSFG